MANRIQLRRDGAQQWANVNPILAQGELGIEIDTSRLKVGDGVTAWNSLKYERPIETESNTANTLVKRDADGNFEAGAITASLVGNSATATRLANARNIALGGDMSGSGTFDGSSNLTITAELNYVDGVTSNIQTQIDAISGSGTMSKFHIGSTTQVDPNQISLGDGSGLFFAAGSNMTITTTNTDRSGVITFAADSSGGSARSVSGDTDDAIITWKTSDNTFVAESNLT